MKHGQPLVDDERGLSTWGPADSVDNSAKTHRVLMPIPGAALSIIVPTFNERVNLAELIKRLDKSLMGCSWEVIFVDDDSPDGTSTFVRQIARRDCRVRCIQRIGRRGLSSACIEGMLASSAPYLAVIDGDLQHDETLLRPMLDALKTGEEDIVIGSRYISGGGIGVWDVSRAQRRRQYCSMRTAVPDMGTGLKLWS